MCLENFSNVDLSLKDLMGVVIEHLSDSDSSSDDDSDEMEIDDNDCIDSKMKPKEDGFMSSRRSKVSSPKDTRPSRRRPQVAQKCVGIDRKFPSLGVSYQCDVPPLSAMYCSRDDMKEEKGVDHKDSGRVWSFYPPVSAIQPLTASSSASASASATSTASSSFSSNCSSNGCTAPLSNSPNAILANSTVKNISTNIPTATTLTPLPPSPPPPPSSIPPTSFPLHSSYTADAVSGDVNALQQSTTQQMVEEKEKEEGDNIFCYWSSTTTANEKLLKDEMDHTSSTGPLFASCPSSSSSSSFSSSTASLSSSSSPSSSSSCPSSSYSSSSSTTRQSKIYTETRPEYIAHDLMVDRALMAAMIAQFIPGMIVTYINGGGGTHTLQDKDKGNPGKLKVKHPEKGGGASAGAGGGGGGGGGGGEGQHRSSKRISLVTGAGLKTARFGCIVKGPFYSRTTSTASNSASSPTAPAVTVNATGLGAALLSSSLGDHDNTPSITDEMVMTLMIGQGDEVSSYCYYCCCCCCYC